MIPIGPGAAARRCGRGWAVTKQTSRSDGYWDQADVLLINLTRGNAKKYLYQLYSERVASMRMLPFDPEWDGATNYETK